MAFRDDISVNWVTSPRIITVAAPSTEVTIQDLYDTLKEIEQQTHNLIYPELITAAGKENLGGGVLVGLTAELQNAVLAFEARTDSDSAGTVTTANAEGTTLTDSAATFISDGIVPGDSIINRTDGSVATVLSVDSETQITHYPLNDGVDNDWDSADVYKIWNKIQCNIAGGNLVSVNEADVIISSVMPTFGTHIVRTSSSSATLQEQNELQFSTFEGKVTIDATSGITGTSFPKGTALEPVNNIIDALSIASSRGLSRLFFVGDFTFEAGDNVSLYELEGKSVGGATLTFNPGSICIGSEFLSCSVEGTLTSPRSFFQCRLKDIIGATIGISGTIIVRSSGFEGTVTLSPLLEGEIHIIESYSAIAGGSNKPMFDINGANVDVLVRHWSGGMQVSNFSNPANNTISIDIDSGNIILDDTCTSGDITIRGVGEWLNESTYAGTTTVVNDLVGRPTIQEEFREMAVDGVTFQQYAQASLAALTGKMVITQNGPNDTTIEFKSQDGSTTFVTGRVQNGVRTESDVNDENM